MNRQISKTPTQASHNAELQLGVIFHSLEDFLKSGWFELCAKRLDQRLQISFPE